MLGSGAGGVVGGAIVRLILDSTQFNKGLAEAKGQFATTANALNASGRSMMSLGASLTRGLTVPIAVAGVAAGKLATDFESAMAKVEGLSGVAHDEMVALSKEVLDLSRTLPQTPEQLAEGLYYITSSGIDAADSMDVLTASAKAAAAGLGDTLTVADLVTGALNVYKDENLTAANAVDILVAAVREGKGEPEDFAQYLGQAMSAAEQANVSFGELAGSIAGLTNQQISLNRAATGVRFLLTSIAKPTPEAVAALDDVGWSVQQLQDSIAERGLAFTLRELADTFDVTTVKGKRAFVVLTGGVRGYTVAARLAETGNSDLLNIIDEVVNSSGDLDKAFGVASQTASFKFNAALSSIQATLIQLGSAFMPTVARIVEGIGKMFDRLGALAPETQQAIVKILIALAALGPALLIAGKTMKMVGGAVLTFGKIRTAIQGVSGAFPMLGAAAEAVVPGLGALFSPVGAIILGVAAAVAVVAYVIIKNWKTISNAIRPAVEMLVSSFSEAWNSMRSALSELWNALKPILGAIGAIIVGVVIAAVYELAAVWSFLAKAIGPVLSALVRLIALALKPLGAAISWVADNWQSFVKVIGDGVSSILGGLAKVADGLAYLRIIPRDWADGLQDAANAADKWGETTVGATEDVVKSTNDTTDSVEDLGLTMKRTMNGVRGMLGMTAKESKEWRTDFTGSIDPVSNALEELSGKAKVTSAQIIAAFEKQMRATRDYGKNLEAIVARGLPREWVTQLTAMGLDGAGIVAALADANDAEFKRIVDRWTDASNDADQVVAAVRRIDRAVNGLNDKDITITITTIQRTAKLALESQYRGASGGIVTRPTFALIGEAGPEAVVPLNSAPGASPLGALGGSMDLTVNVRMDRKRFLRDADYASSIRGY